MMEAFEALSVANKLTVMLVPILALMIGVTIGVKK
jgi:hypothetical protein